MIRNFLMASLTISLSISTAFAQQKAIRVTPQRPHGETFALLIGVNKYPEPVPSLEYCVKDVQVLAMTLANIGVPKRNIFLMVDTAKRVNYRPIKSNIEYQIEKMTQLVTEDDQLIVSFSGHGAQLNKVAYLCPQDMNDLKPETLIEREWVYQKLSQCRARKKLLLIDACRDELIASKAGMKSLSKLRSLGDPLGDTQSQGFALLASCSPGQFSLEDGNQLKQGVFSYFVAQGLEGKADANGDRSVTFDELYRYVHQNTRRHALQLRDIPQVPTRGGEFSGDFVLAVIPKDIPIVAPPRDQKESQAPSVASTSDKTRKAGERLVLKIEEIEYPFRWCPPGVFIMGSPGDEEGRGRVTAETRHRVTLTYGFWMLETEVTQEMMESLIGKNPSFFQGPKHPVEKMSWDECLEFIRALNELSVAPSGYRFLLPTEAQWEYACRAGTTTPYHFGSELKGDKANCNGRNPCGTDERGPFLGKTTPVGSYPANAWGLFDMHGNVYEVCSDYLVAYSGHATNPVGVKSGPLTNHAMRGGSWNSPASYCRSASRISFGFNSYENGFRLALVNEKSIPPRRR